jgi:Lon protease-like protein
MLPIFPLPSTVVFPGMRVPLYIFEARYRRLVKLCLEQEEPRFVIALARRDGVIREGRTPFYPVGTFVRILQLGENPDGSYALLGYGQERCRLGVAAEEPVSEADGSRRALYFTEDDALPLERGDLNLERVAAWDALEVFREYAKTFFAFDALRQMDEALPEDLVFQASFICANIRVTVDSRQVLLEAPSLTERFQLAQKLMRERLAAHRPASS